MKFFIISLALAIFAGSQPQFLISGIPQENIENRLVKFFREWEEFLEDFSNRTEKRWDQFTQSKTGKLVMKLIEDEEKETSPEGNGKGAPKEDEDILDAVIDKLADVVDKVVDEVEKEALPTIKKFDAAVAAMVGHHLDPLIKKVEDSVGSLVQHLANVMHELDQKLDKLLPQQLEILDSFAPQYLQKLQDEDVEQKASRK